MLQSILALTGGGSDWGHGLLTGNREPRNVLKRSRKVDDPEQDQSNNAPGDIACGVVGNGVEADGPGENVTGHAENEEDGLSSATKLSAHPGHAKRLEEYLESIRHIVDLCPAHQSPLERRK